MLPEKELKAKLPAQKGVSVALLHPDHPENLFKDCASWAHSRWQNLKPLVGCLHTLFPGALMHADLKITELS